jgi:hypothetical protein
MAKPQTQQLRSAVAQQRKNRNTREQPITQQISRPPQSKLQSLPLAAPHCSQVLVTITQNHNDSTMLPRFLDQKSTVSFILQLPMMALMIAHLVPYKVTNIQPLFRKFPKDSWNSHLFPLHSKQKTPLYSQLRWNAHQHFGITLQATQNTMHCHLHMVLATSSALDPNNILPN